MWMTSCTGSARGGFRGFWKKSVSWVLRSEEEGWLSLARQASGGDTCVDRGRWKSQNRKNVYLSPYVEKPLNSKVIKSFAPELKSRKCFSCFGIPMFYVYMLRTFYARFIYQGYVTLVMEGLGKYIPDELNKEFDSKFSNVYQLWLVGSAMSKIATRVKIQIRVNQDNESFPAIYFPPFNTQQCTVATRKCCNTPNFYKVL